MRTSIGHKLGGAGHALRSAFALLALFTLLLGLGYPALLTLAARSLFPAGSGGSLILVDGRPAGSALIGQPFSDPSLFWGRPSATPARPYSGTASGGSNLGPTNPALIAAVSDRVARLRAADPDNDRPVPIDLVTASASGLDPHISPDAAIYQIPRVARARALSEQTVRALVLAHIEGPSLGFLGERRVNVLRLNLALIGLAPASPKWYPLGRAEGDPP